MKKSLFILVMALAVCGCRKDEAPNTSLEGTWEFVNYRDYTTFFCDTSEYVLGSTQCQADGPEYFFLTKIDSIKTDSCYSSWNFYNLSSDTGSLKQYYYINPNYALEKKGKFTG